jgi:leucyl-tRNA synthetase
VKPWQTSGIQGVRRFLDRVHSIGTRTLSGDPMDGDTARIVHRTVKKVGEDIEALRLNTPVSAMMILANHLNGQKAPSKEAVERLLLCLSPYAPHLAEELWEAIGNAPSIARVPFPEVDEALCVDETLEMPVQVNGRVRGKIVIARESTEAQARDAALADENVQKHIGDQSVRKVVYVPGRILNFIVG